LSAISERTPPTASPLTGQARQTADLPKKNDTPQKHSESSQKVVRVKLLSSKEKAVFTVDGETVCLSISIIVIFIGCC